MRHLSSLSTLNVGRGTDSFVHVGKERPTKMQGENILLEDGYFVCVKKAGLKQPEILTALLADGACFEGCVGKLSFLQGATVPNEIPSSPAFIAKDVDDGFIITPGGWMPWCPVLYGADGLVPHQRDLLEMGGLDKSSKIMTTDCIMQHAEKATIAISQDKGKRWAHVSSIPATNCLSDKDVENLFTIFPHVQADRRQDYVIYMINTLHGAASVALKEIKWSTKRRLTLNLMQTVGTRCEKADMDALQAVLVPYYSQYSVGGAESLQNNKYMDVIQGLTDQQVSDFGDVGERVPVPDIPFMAHTCASDVYKMFPGGIDKVDCPKLTLELCRAVALSLPGKRTTASGTMDPVKYKMTAPSDLIGISRSGTDVATFICLATLYTANTAERDQLRDYEPRHLHILNMLERMRTLREQEKCDDIMKWRLMELIDDMHAATYYMYMDPGSAIHRLEYENLAVGKPEERRDIKSFAAKTYQRSLLTINDVNHSVRLWLATGGDFVMYAALIRFLERDLWRCMSENRVTSYMATPVNCPCTDPDTCVLRIYEMWCKEVSHIQPQKEDRTNYTKPNLSSAADGIHKRSFLKRTARGGLKESEKIYHDSIFTGTMRCTSAYDIVCSPIGDAALRGVQEGTPVSMYENQIVGDNQEQQRKFQPLSTIINSIMKKMSIGTETENNSLYEMGMAAGTTALETTMAANGMKQLTTMLFKDSCHVAIENGEALWDPGTRNPIYAPMQNGKMAPAVVPEVKAVIKEATDIWLNKIIHIMRTIRKECLEIKNSTEKQLTVDMMWKIILKCDPNLNQYDGMNAALLAATMLNILRPVVTVLKAVGILFPQSGFMKEFPYFDRSKLDDVFGSGGNVQFGMDGTFTAQDSDVSLFIHSNPPTHTPCKWEGSFNIRMIINTCRLKAICKGRDVNYNASKKNKNKTPSSSEELLQQQQQHSGDTNNTEKDCFAESVKRVLSTAFVFETDDDDDDVTYQLGLQEIQKLLPWDEHIDPTNWMRGTLISGILSIVKKKSKLTKVMELIPSILDSCPKFRYVSKILDLLSKTYAPRDFFLPGNELGMCHFKYMLAYMGVCRMFNAPTFHVKPSYTVSAFVGPCKKNRGRAINCVLNYDTLCAQDAPYVNVPMDYTIYGHSMQNKVFGGGRLMKLCHTQTGLKGIAEVPTSKSAFFVMITPCIPFPNRSKEDVGIGLLSAMSFESVVSYLESEKRANFIARLCGYDELRSTGSVETAELAEKLFRNLSVSTNEAEIIARLLQAKASKNNEDHEKDDDIDMIWEDVDVPNQEVHNTNTETTAEDLVKMYE